MNVVDYNRMAWDEQVRRGNHWTKPVSAGITARARQGEWEIILTPTKPVPRSWFPALPGLRILCLAGAGGQQAPVLAAAGADVTVLDNSPKQLEQDRFVAERDGLQIRTLLGEMGNLSVFEGNTFDLVVNPCSVDFVPDISSVWSEVFRVLRPGGTLLAGFINPFCYIFDEKLAEQGQLTVRHRLPYSDLHSISEAERAALFQDGEPMVFSHSLDETLGGQIAAGFVITGFYEDVWPEKFITQYAPGFLATRARKPEGPPVFG
jgi:2-polyprenyl-3-methyl-5-hydroxy-6-metoxy-1,4-benzoquinol methylase